MAMLFLEVTNKDGSITKIGSWKEASDRIDNFYQQTDVGWHIFLAFSKGAKSVSCILVDDVDKYLNE